MRTANMHQQQPRLLVWWSTLSTAGKVISIEMLSLPIGKIKGEICSQFALRPKKRWWYHLLKEKCCFFLQPSCRSRLRAGYQQLGMGRIVKKARPDWLSSRSVSWSPPLWCEIKKKQSRLGWKSIVWFLSFSMRTTLSCAFSIVFVMIQTWSWKESLGRYHAIG